MFEFSNIIIKTGFVLACLVNSLLIYVTSVHVTYIKGSYKYLIIIFASTCILFDSSEVLSRPYLHNFNGSFLYLSLNRCKSEEVNLREFYLTSILFHAGLYVSIIELVTVQFIYRYASVHDYINILKSFRRANSLFWILVVVVPGATFTFVASFTLIPDEYGDAYLKKEVQRVYERNIEDVPRVIMIPYDDKNIRWDNVSFNILAISIMTIQYFIIFFCAIKMKLNIANQLKKFSFRHRTLENQFFKALLVQIALPTLILTLPIMPVFIIPLLDIEISFHSAIFYSALSLYPSLDSIALMLIVSEYRKCLKKLWKSWMKSDKKEACYTLETAAISAKSRLTQTPVLGIV